MAPVKHEWVLCGAVSVSGRKKGVNPVAGSVSVQRSAPDELVRIALAFDTGEDKAGNEGHVYRFVAIICIDGECTAYIGFCRRRFEGFQSLGNPLFAIADIITAVSEALYQVLNKVRCINKG